MATDLDKPVPPAGEEIHLPPGSLQPIVLTVGVTMLLLGITVTWWLIALGGLLTVGSLVAWIKDTVDEIRHLPSHGDH